MDTRQEPSGQARKVGRRFVALTAVLLLAMQTAAMASHFRYGNNSWKPGPGATEVQFQVSEGWRWSAFGSPAVGTVTSSDNLLDFGDGNTTLFQLLVTSVDAANDWFYGVALDPNRPAGNTSDTLINHTYPAAGNYLVTTASCCRIGQITGGNWHVNNPDGSQRVETIVNVGGTNASPVSTMPPIVLCPINGNCTFTVPASDSNGDTLRYRLSTSAEAGGFTQPGPPDATNAASVNAFTGVYTWDTTGATLAPAGSTTLYSTQVTIEDRDAAGAVKSKTAVDFLIQLTNQVGSAPVFDQPPSPACGSTLNASVGAPLTFTVQASDADAADTVTLNGVGIPPGATMNPVLPATGNPVSSQFAWTPTAAQTGNYVLTFAASDGTGQQALCSYTIVVGGTQPPGDDESLSGLKYYDANANGQHDAGEPGIENWVVDVNDGGATTSVATDADGEFSLDVEPGTFTVAEQQAAGWIQTGNSVDQSGGTGDVTLNADMTYSVELEAGETATGLNFGNLCVGVGGGRTIGFWGNKNGKALFNTDSAGALLMLQDLNLRNEDGSVFDPATWAQLERWLKGARAVNQAYMLSAQLAAMALNVHFGLVDPDALILAEGSASANAAGFATVQDIMDEADAALGADGLTPAGDPNRAIQATLSRILDAANNNKTFVQAGPADCATPEFPLLFEDDFNAENGGAGALNYGGFAQWGVTDGTVDLIGMPAGFFDFFPTQGLYVDLDGSTNDSGILATQDTFALLPGTYELSFKLAGSQRGSSETVNVSLGSAFSDSYTRASGDSLGTVTETIVVTTATSGQLVFENAGGDNVGAILDDVRLERL